MPARKTNHIHKFNRLTYKTTGNSIYFCINDCPTNFKIDVKLSLGKTNLCNICGTPFTMNEYSIRQAKPRCMNCVKRKGQIVNPSDELAPILNRRETVRRTNDKELVSLAGKEIQNDLNQQFNNLLVREYQEESEDDDL